LRFIQPGDVPEIADRPPAAGVQQRDLLAPRESRQK
jgi:hypothetical protein